MASAALPSYGTALAGCVTSAAQEQHLVTLPRPPPSPLRIVAVRARARVAPPAGGRRARARDRRRDELLFARVRRSAEQRE